MKLTYKFIIPIALISIFTIFFIVIFLQQSLSQALFQEEFFKVEELVLKKSSTLLKEEYFLDPFSPTSQDQFEAFSAEVKDSTMARFTIWSQHKTVLFSDLKSIIGLQASQQNDLDRTLQDLRPSYIQKAKDTSVPMQSDVGEFLDIYVPIRVSDSISAVIQVQSVTGAILLPVTHEINNIIYSLVACMLGIFVVILVAFRVFIAKPMKVLENTAIEVSKSNFTARSYLKTKDEIGYFSSVFDQMLFYVQTYQDKIKNYATQVEQEVKVRTKELTEERARLIASINSFPVGFILGDTQGKIYLSNTSLLEILDVVESPKTIPDITEILAASLDVYQQYQACLTNKEFISMPEVIFRAKILHIVLAPVIITREQEEVIGAVVLVEDITERRAMERSKDEFFSIASHELRTPLTAIRGNASLILDFYKKTIKDEQVREMIEDIFKSSTLLLRIANDFLDVVRLEQRKIVFKKESVDLVKVVKEVLKEYKEMAAEKGITLRLQPSREVLSLASADSDRIQQVLIDLIGNAIHYTVKGNIVISIKQLDRFLKISVKDTGIGIAPQYQGLLFKKFQQAQEKILTRDVTQGTGLGLYISKLMVESMGGTIALEESTVGKGSTFSFTLPIV